MVDILSDNHLKMFVNRKSDLAKQTVLPGSHYSEQFCFVPLKSFHNIPSMRIRACTYTCTSVFVAQEVENQCWLGIKRWIVIAHSFPAVDFLN